MTAAFNNWGKDSALRPVQQIFVTAYRSPGLCANVVRLDIVVKKSRVEARIIHIGRSRLTKRAEADALKGAFVRSWIIECTFVGHRHAGLSVFNKLSNRNQGVKNNFEIASFSIYKALRI